MEFRILGPFQVIVHGRTVPIASHRQRALLALLLLHANEPLSADRILDELWGDSPPESGAKAVAFHVSRLRRALALEAGQHDSPTALATTEAGYVLRTDPTTIDAVEADRLGKEGESLLAEDPASALDRLTAALNLWRGEPLSDLTYESFAQAEIDRLGELRLRLTEDRVEADLALGRHADLVGELQDLVAANPYRERLRGQLMLALYRGGRQADALRAFQDGRRLLVEELGIDPSPELQELERTILRQDPTLTHAPLGPVARNPFKGLRPFDERDAGDFFGREALIARLVDRLGEVARGDRLLVLVGPSGSGKSSVVRAGLVPAIRRGALPGSEAWRVATMVPGSHPFEELAAALKRAGAGVVQPSELRPPGALAHQLARIVPDGRLVLVIDQSEELFWRVGDGAGQGDFTRAIADGMARAGGRLLVVATLRADALDRALSTPALADVVRTGLEVVGRLTRDELTQAITKPAEAVSVEVQEGLVPQLVHDVEGRPGMLPLLQYALTELYDHGGGRRLTRDAYEALGGVTGVVGRRAEAIYHDLGPNERATAREVFLRLIDIHEGAAPTARRVLRGELRSLDDSDDTIEKVLDAFGRGRLLSFDRDPVSGEPTVEPAHEALLSSWGRVIGWVEEARESLWMRHRLSEAAAEWEDAGRDAGYLLAGSRLELFHDWAKSATVRLSADEDAYLAASLAEEQRKEEAEATRQAEEQRLARRAARWLRASVALFAVLALLAVGFAGFALVRGEADRQQQAIAVSRELAAASTAKLDANPELSLLLATEAAVATADRGFVTEEAFDALNWALQRAATPYPADATPTAVRDGPDGPRGVYLVSVGQLLQAAVDAASRTLSEEECLTYLHRADCAPPTLSDLDVLGVHVQGRTVPPEQLATAGLADTHVRIAAELPAEIQLPLEGFEARTGINVDVTSLQPNVDEGGDVSADVILTPRSGLVLELARQGRVVDLSSVTDLASLRTSGGDALADGWSAKLAGSSRAGLYGAPAIASLDGLVWYPRKAFDAAGYAVPQSWEELEGLTAKMIEDGAAAPWCLGMQDGDVAGGSGADWVEDLVLLANGPETYLDWSTGDVRFLSGELVASVGRFGATMLSDGALLGGPASALTTPDTIAGLPLVTDPPRCWLLRGPSTAATAWSTEAYGLGVFPLPPIDPANRGLSRGRVYGLGLVQDRPEVRALLDELLSVDAAHEMMRMLGPSGLYPLADVDPMALLPGTARAAAERLAGSLRKGTFFADASDAMPPAVGSAAFPDGIARYLASGDPQWVDLWTTLNEMDVAWPDPWP